MDDFLLPAFLAAAGLALAAGPLGCFVVWRKMAYFGDTLAHSALLGVVIGIVLGIGAPLGVAGIAILAALVLAGIERRGGLSADTVLGILSHGTLAVGLVALAFVEAMPLDRLAWLTGDILSVSTQDIAAIWAAAILVLGGLAAFWRPLVALTVNEDLARVEGHPVGMLRLGLMALVALTVAVAMKVVGVLLVTALLVMPAAAARRLAATPEGMAVWAAVAGLAAVVLGLAASWYADTPSGPSIVVAALVCFVLSQAVPRR